jgi:thiamine biosynthesis lipoprotein
MKKRKISYLLLMTASLFYLSGCTQSSEYKVIDGFTQGTTYHIVYDYNQKDSLNFLVDSLLAEIDTSMSVYNPLSLVSKINNGTDSLADSLFIKVFNKSVQINKISEGAFDISGAPLFEAWGFGAKDKKEVTPKMVDSILQFVGMDKVWLEGNKVVKSDKRVSLNFNAIAQGFTSDVIAAEFDKRGIENYLIEVGGEIYCKGKNASGNIWSVGIDKPEEGNIIPGESVEAVILLSSNKGLATSGNYRKFIEENGEKYSHTIDPRTGYPIKNTLLSATVIASEAMTADALATFFMVVGMDKTKEYLAAHPEIDAFLVYSENGKFAIFKTSGVTLK